MWRTGRLVAVTACCLFVHSAAAEPARKGEMGPRADAEIRASGIQDEAPRPPSQAVELAPVEYTDEERRELNALGETVKRFERKAMEFRALTRRHIEEKYKKKRDQIFQSYEKKIIELEREQRLRRDAAIERFQGFLRQYPDDERYTPDAMFRLSELLFERSYDDYFQARQNYDRLIAQWDPDSDDPEPQEPLFHYEPTIAMMQRLITEFPRYRLLDGAYYLLGFCLGEQGEEERAVVVYEELVGLRPNSHFAPEVWTRIGEYYFNTNELQRALEAYTHVLGHMDSPFYDKALYKLAWTHYRLADPERAPEEFQLAVDTFVQLLDFHEKTKAEGRARGGDLRVESIQYVAICFAEERWGGQKMAVDYFAARPGKPYEREILEALGDVYFDQTRFDEAVSVYRYVQKRYPGDPGAPGVQEKIVTALERDRDFESAAAEREFMTASYSEGTPWYKQNANDPVALHTANKLTEKALYSAALFHHRQAQIHKEAQKIDLAQGSYVKAAEAYGAYLERFPHSGQLYELNYFYAECLYYSLRFEEAADRYKWVRDSNADSTYLEESAFSVVLSYENALKLAEVNGKVEPLTILKSTERGEDQPVTPRDLPPFRKRLVVASDAYADRVGKNEKASKILYKAAETYYAFDHFDEARRRFNDIIRSFPGTEVAEFASNLTIESYLTEKNFPEVEAFSRKLLSASTSGDASPGRKEFTANLVKFKTGAMFKIADDLVAKEEYEKGAELYLKLVEENPDTQFGDLAINNAAVAYEQVKRYDSASRLYERLVADHPNSPLADSALFRVGLNAERFFDFEKAITSYRSLFKKYPKSERRADAIYNAALALENTQDYEDSAREYLRYCELFPKRDDAPQVCFRAGAVYAKMGDMKRVISTYEKFIRRYRGNKQHQDRVIEAHLRVAKAFEHLKKIRDSRKYFERTVKEFERGGAEVKSAPYAAEARFNLVEVEFADFRKLKITGNTKQQKRGLTQKANVLKKVQKSYNGILQYKQMDWTLAALYRIGQLYQDFAESLINAPCPRDVRRAARSMGATEEEVCGEYRVLLEERAASIEDKAVQAFETTVTRAREFQVVNKWTKQTLVALNRLRRSLWPLQKDAVTYLDERAVGAPPTVTADGSVMPRLPGSPGGSQGPGPEVSEGTATAQASNAAASAVESGGGSVAGQGTSGAGGSEAPGGGTPDPSSHGGSGGRHAAPPPDAGGSAPSESGSPSSG